MGWSMYRFDGYDDVAGFDFLDEQRLRRVMFWTGVVIMAFFLAASFSHTFGLFKKFYGQFFGFVVALGLDAGALMLNIQRGLDRSRRKLTANQTLINVLVFVSVIWANVKMSFEQMPAGDADHWALSWLGLTSWIDFLLGAVVPMALAWVMSHSISEAIAAITARHRVKNDAFSPIGKPMSEIREYLADSLGVENVPTKLVAAYLGITERAVQLREQKERKSEAKQNGKIHADEVIRIPKNGKSNGVFVE